MTKKNNKYTVIRDTREHSEKGWLFDEDESCAGTKVQKLDYGDYSIDGIDDNIFAIERKGSVNEIYQNFGVDKDRFYRELEALSKFKYSYLILECDVGDIVRGCSFSTMSPNFVLSCILSLTTRYGINVLFVGKHGKEMAKMLFKKMHKMFGK